MFKNYYIKLKDQGVGDMLQASLQDTNRFLDVSFMASDLGGGDLMFTGKWIEDDISILQSVLVDLGIDDTLILEVESDAYEKATIEVNKDSYKETYYEQFRNNCDNCGEFTHNDEIEDMCYCNECLADLGDLK
jgi:hypothetical protein